MKFHVDEKEIDDPGLMWIVDSFAVHNALGLPGAPIMQGMYMLIYSGHFCLCVNVSWHESVIPFYLSCHY